MDVSMMKPGLSVCLLFLLTIACALTPAAQPSVAPRPLPAPSATAAPLAATASPAPAISQPPSVISYQPSAIYDIGSPALADLWVDPVNGDDSRSGAARDQALRTLTEAWNRIPVAAELTTGYRVLLAAGTYTADMIPVYFESRYGTAQAPIIFQSADGPAAAVLGGFLNIYDTRYLYLIDLAVIPDPPGDVIHCEKCDHFLIRGNVLNGGEDQDAHETVKVNQSQFVFIETSDISGTYENAIDFVAVQYGHITGNRLHNAGDWCAYVKGGSAYIRVEGNEIYDCGTGGFTAGQGTGFQYMVAPWIQYEAYDIKVVNNVIHDTVGAGLGVNGGYNILLAHNTLYRVGQNSHTMEFAFGLRSCDGQPGDEGRERCDQNLAAGGWGTTAIDDGTNAARIPNKNVFVYNNILYNPPGYQSQWQNFAIFGPFSGAAQNGSNVATPTLADDNLQIRGNIIWDGGPDHPLGIEDSEQGCQPSNPVCNVDQLRAENAINTIEPSLIDPANGNFHPAPGGNVYSAVTFPIPDFLWDVPAPAGELSNAVTTDRDGSAREASSPPGAHK